MRTTCFSDDEVRVLVAMTKYMRNREKAYRYFMRHRPMHANAFEVLEMIKPSWAKDSHAEL